jgi:hypothetical protein
MDLKEMFDAADDEFLRFESIESPRHPLADVCAFMMLHELVPAPGDIVSAAEHDEIYLATDPDALAKVATSEIIRDLHRCGVRYDENMHCLCMFV